MSEQTLRQKIEARIQQYRTAISELTDLLKEQPFSAPTPSKAAATVASEEPNTGRGRPRKRRAAGWLAGQVKKVLASKPGLTVSEIAEGVSSQSGQKVTSSAINVFLSKGAKAGSYSKDTSAGLRKTKWSLAGGASEGAEEGKKKKKA